MIDIIDSIGETRFLMPLESQKVTKAFKTFGDAGTPTRIPREVWKPVNLRPFCPPVKDQDGIGACNAFATVTATEIARAVAGLEYVPLSTGYLYGAINGQRDQGSMLEDAIEWMGKNGTCDASTVGMLDWQKGKWPAGVADKAKQYRVLEYFWTPEFDDFASGIQYGFAGNIGMMWASSDNPDGNGYLPDRVGGRAGGHAIAVTGLVYENGKWALECQNSWSPKWGWDGGRFKISESRCKSEAGNFGWFVVRATTFPSDQGIPQPT